MEADAELDAAQQEEADFQRAIQVRLRVALHACLASPGQVISSSAWWSALRHPGFPGVQSLEHCRLAAVRRMPVSCAPDAQRRSLHEPLLGSVAFRRQHMLVRARADPSPQLGMHCR